MTKKINRKLEKEHSTLQTLILKNKSTTETDWAKELISKAKEVKINNRFTNQLLFDIAEWKSHRRASLCKKNRNKTVNKILQEVLASSDEKERMKLLIRLKGVRIPVASAILTILDPRNYGVIDYRVWEILYLYGLVDTKPSGRNLSLTNWLQYLEIIRSLAKENKMKARDIDRTLFNYHQKLEEKSKTQDCKTK